jgi:hypothetical protein
MGLRNFSGDKSRGRVGRIEGGVGSRRVGRHEREPATVNADRTSRPEAESSTPRRFYLP